MSRRPYQPWSPTASSSSRQEPTAAIESTVEDMRPPLPRPKRPEHDVLTGAVVHQRRLALELEAVGRRHRVVIERELGSPQRPRRVADVGAPHPPAVVERVQAVALRQPAGELAGGRLARRVAHPQPGGRPVARRDSNRTWPPPRSIRMAAWK